MIRTKSRILKIVLRSIFRILDFVRIIFFWYVSRTKKRYVVKSEYVPFFWHVSRTNRDTCQKTKYEPHTSPVHEFHESTNFTSPRVFEFMRVIELLPYLRRLYVLPEILELPHVCSFLRSDVERRIDVFHNCELVLLF